MPGSQNISPFANRKQNSCMKEPNFEKHKHQPTMFPCNACLHLKTPTSEIVQRKICKIAYGFSWIEAAASLTKPKQRKQYGKKRRKTASTTHSISLILSPFLIPFITVPQPETSFFFSDAFGIYHLLTYLFVRRTCDYLPSADIYFCVLHRFLWTKRRTI